MDDREATVVAGRVGRPHGLDGSFHVLAPVPVLLVLGGSVTVAGRACEIDRRAGTDDRPILRLASHGDRDAAQALSGEPLLVAAADAPPLEEGEFWAHELEGCRVTDGDRVVGRVLRLVALPSCEVLEVDREDGRPGELLVPLVRDAVREVDPADRRIDVDMGFIEGPDEPG